MIHFINNQLKFEYFSTLVKLSLCWVAVIINYIYAYKNNILQYLYQYKMKL